jgi:polynucleotide 5'-kinase involved in rRNA processing
MVVGAPDTGKSTFAHYLYEQLSEAGKAAAFLDGDAGQACAGSALAWNGLSPSFPQS